MIITVGNNYFDIDIDNSHRDFYYVNWLFYNSNYLVGRELHIMKYNGNDFVIREILQSIFMRITTSYFSEQRCSREESEIIEFKHLIHDSYPNHQFRMITEPQTIRFARYQPLTNRIVNTNFPNFSW